MPRSPLLRRSCSTCLFFFLNDPAPPDIHPLPPHPPLPIARGPPPPPTPPPPPPPLPAPPRRERGAGHAVGEEDPRGPGRAGEPREHAAGQAERDQPGEAPVG